MLVIGQKRLIGAGRTFRVFTGKASTYALRYSFFSCLLPSFLSIKYREERVWHSGKFGQLLLEVIKRSAILKVETNRQTCANLAYAEDPYLRAVVLLFNLVHAYVMIKWEKLARFLLRLSLDFNGINPILYAFSRESILDKVWIQVYQLGVLTLRVYYANEIHRLVVLTTRNAHCLVQVEHSFQAIQVFRLNWIKPETHWYWNKNTFALVDLLLNLLEKDVAIVADDHWEIRVRFLFFIQLLEHTADGLRTIPISWLFFVFSPDFSDHMDPKRAQVLVDQVVHKQGQNFVVFQKSSFVKFCTYRY